MKTIKWQGRNGGDHRMHVEITEVEKTIGILSGLHLLPISSFTVVDFELPEDDLSVSELKARIELWQEFYHWLTVDETCDRMKEIKKILGI